MQFSRTSLYALLVAYASAQGIVVNPEVPIDIPPAVTIPVISSVVNIPTGITPPEVIITPPSVVITPPVEVSSVPVVPTETSAPPPPATSTAATLVPETSATPSATVSATATATASPTQSLAPPNGPVESIFVTVWPSTQTIPPNTVVVVEGKPINQPSATSQLPPSVSPRNTGSSFRAPLGVAFVAVLAGLAMA